MPDKVKERKIEPERKTIEMKKPKTINKNEDNEKFNKLLDRCLGFLSDAMAGGGEDVFKLLDPMISDTQCHIHSVLILSILRKCENDDESNYNGIENLIQRDKRILSYAVLFSLLKTEYKDIFGFVIHEVSIRNFNSTILSSRKREKYYINEAKKNFNSYSMDYIKSVAFKRTKEILNDCKSRSLISPAFQFLPCYASTYAVIDYLKAAKLPIIVSLISINTQDSGEDTIVYRANSTDVRFYEFREDEDKFFHKKDLNDYEKKIPTITFDCYSIINNRRQNLSTDYDITDLLMLLAASHIQLPKHATLPAGYRDEEDYARDLYKVNNEVADKYKRHYELGEKYNLINSRYSRIVRTSIEKGDEGISITVERRREDCFFSVDHVHLSNYSRECQRFRSLDLTRKAYRREVFKFNMEEVTLKALRRFVS